MKIKTSELIGAALDWAVAKCEGILHPWGYIRVQDGRTMWITPGDHETADAWHQYSPSTDWAQGGPVIEWEGISTVQEGDAADWVASVYDHKADDWHLHTLGETPLIAAMRCYVASKLGDEVEIPEELAP